MNGYVWTVQAPTGEIDVNTGVLYQGDSVVFLHFSLLRVYYDGIHIVSDYPANQEMTCYGQ